MLHLKDMEEDEAERQEVTGNLAALKETGVDAAAAAAAELAFSQ